MAVRSNYPGQLDTDVELPRVDDNISEIGSDAINSIRDAIFSIQNTIGVNPQGNMGDLVSRVNGVIDNNGQLKSSALSDKGLITLPIVANQIAPDAGIEESKLDLEYSTASLYAGINSLRTDLNTLSTSFTAFVAQGVNHFSGVSNRHDGYHIDLIEQIRSSDDVETALHVINNAFTDHAESTVGAHHALGIAVNDEFETISATDVQGALVELDHLGALAVNEAVDSLHETAVAANQRGESGIQGNQRISTMALTVFQTELVKAPHIAMVMRPNVARVTSKNLDLRAVKAGETHTLRVQAGGIDRGPLDINLTATLPTEDIDDIVRAINVKAQGCTDHYPIAAYNTGGQLTIAHIMAGDEFTIQIGADVIDSAHVALGFANIAGTSIGWSGRSHAGYAGGIRIHELKSLIKIHHNHTTKPLSTLVLGLGDLSDYGLTIGNEGRYLVNITKHSTNPDDNGTHYILGYPTNEKFVLSADIQLGEFDLEIMADSVSFETSANGEIFDIFVEDADDGYGVVTKSRRISYQPISGINVKAMSESFPANQNTSWEISSGAQVQLFVNNLGGEQEPIPTGYIGEIKAYAPDNVNSALFQITSVPAGGASLRRPITVEEFAGTDDRIHIGSVHHAGNFNDQLKFVTDRRLIGTTVSNRTFDPFKPASEQISIKDLRNNGVVRGFDIMSSDGGTMLVRGGRAYVDGRPLDVETQEISVSDFGEANYLLMLDKGGKFFVKSEFDAGYTMEELLSGDSYGDNRNVATIAKFHTDGSIIDGYEDRRFMIGNIDKRLHDAQVSLSQRIEEVSSAVAGSFWGNVVAKADVVGDGYLASIEGGDNWGFTDLDERGFSAGDNLVTTRRFEFSNPDTIQTTIFRAVGLTHINVFVQAEYTGNTAGQFGPFGVSGTVDVEIGIAVETGIDDVSVSESFVNVKTIPISIFPSRSVVERYLVSIPISDLGLASNVMFDVVPRVKIVGSTNVDGGPGGVDPNPVIRFDHIRVVTSSYSIAGNIMGEDGSGTALGTTVGDVL